MPHLVDGSVPSTPDHPPGREAPSTWILLKYPRGVSGLFGVEDRLRAQIGRPNSSYVLSVREDSGTAEPSRRYYALVRWCGPSLPPLSSFDIDGQRPAWVFVDSGQSRVWDFVVSDKRIVEERLGRPVDDRPCSACLEPAWETVHVRDGDGGDSSRIELEELDEVFDYLDTVGTVEYSAVTPQYAEYVERRHPEKRETARAILESLVASRGPRILVE